MEGERYRIRTPVVEVPDDTHFPPVIKPEELALVQNPDLKTVLLAMSRLEQKVDWTMQHIAQAYAHMRELEEDVLTLKRAQSQIDWLPKWLKTAATLIAAGALGAAGKDLIGKLWK